jgi:hypothetical protein
VIVFQGELDCFLQGYMARSRSLGLRVSGSQRACEEKHSYQKCVTCTHDFVS